MGTTLISADLDMCHITEALYECYRNPIVALHIMMLLMMMVVYDEDGMMYKDARIPITSYGLPNIHRMNPHGIV